MRSSALVVALICAVDGLRTSKPPSLPRRAALTSAVGAALTSAVGLLLPGAAVGMETQYDVGGALGSTCLGFGCNAYGRPDFNGLEGAPAGSLPYPDFLKAVKEKKVEGVVFLPPSGNVAYAVIDGKSVRIGDGWPIEVSNSWSSPQWVVRQSVAGR